MSVDLPGGLVDLDKQISVIQRTLVEFDTGQRRNVAIIGDPLAGKSSLLDAVATRYGKPVRRLCLTEVTSSAEQMPDLAGREKIIAIDDCQYLFLRRIGGFGALEKFLDVMASSDRLFMTAWNRFAWNYLEQIFNLGDYFPVTVTIPALGIDEIAAVIGARYDLDNIRYQEDETGNSLLTAIRWNAARPGMQDPRRLAFEKIAELSRGNPGVALALWDKAYRDGVVKVSDIEMPDVDPELSPDEAFVMSNILMTKSITRDDLAKVTVGHLRMDRILYTLLSRGLIQNASDRYSVEPLAMYEIVKSLKKSRQVW